MCFLVEAQDDKWIGYVGDTNLAHALVFNGWGLAHHSSLHAAEIPARENQRDFWRGQFVDPDVWRGGKRLPGEKGLPHCTRPGPSKRGNRPFLKVVSALLRSDRG